jgi:hypothetical protein
MARALSVPADLVRPPAPVSPMAMLAQALSPQPQQ